MTRASDQRNNQDSDQNADQSAEADLAALLAALEAERPAFEAWLAELAADAQRELDALLEAMRPEQEAYLALLEAERPPARGRAGGATCGARKCRKVQPLRACMSVNRVNQGRQPEQRNQ